MLWMADTSWKKQTQQCVGSVMVVMPMNVPSRRWSMIMRMRGADACVNPFNGYIHANTMRDMIKGSNKGNISQEYWRDCYHRGQVSLGLDGGIQVGFQGLVLESPGPPPIIGQQTRTW
jgi:hypothetical protein